MEVEKINDETCNFLTKKEINEEIETRLKENEEAKQFILKKYNCNNIDELQLKVNEENPEEINDFNELGDILNEDEFLLSVQHFIPKPKQRAKKVKNDQSKITEFFEVKK